MASKGENIEYVRFPNIHSDPLQHALWVGAYNYESRVKNPRFRLTDATDYIKTTFLMTLTTTERNELLEVARGLDFSELVELMNRVMPQLQSKRGE